MSPFYQEETGSGRLSDWPVTDRAGPCSSVVPASTPLLCGPAHRTHFLTAWSPARVPGRGSGGSSEAKSGKLLAGRDDAIGPSDSLGRGGGTDLCQTCRRAYSSDLASAQDAKGQGRGGGAGSSGSHLGAG